MHDHGASGQGADSLMRVVTRHEKMVCDTIERTEKKHDVSGSSMSAKISVEVAVRALPAPRSAALEHCVQSRRS